jgi:hypothetical protein
LIVGGFLNNEMKGIKGSGHGLFKVIFQDLFGGANENHEKSMSG